MPRLLVPSSISGIVHPKHRVPLYRLECDPFQPLCLPSRRSIRIPTLNELAPLPLLPLHLQPRKVRPAPRAIRLQVHHEAANASWPAVIVVHIVASGTVALRPEALDEDVGAPALEAAGALFDAFDGVVAWERRFFGDADGGVEGLGAAGPDC